MKLPSHDLLVELSRHRELSLAEVEMLLPKHFRDYRDWLPVAGLMKQGFIGNVLKESLEKPLDEKLIASALYGMSLGPGTHKVNNFTAINQDKKPNEVNTTYLTSKGEIYLAERRSERNLRIWSMLTSIVVGATSALIVLLVKQYVFSN